jgi:ferric-dicitrate binding protein FerR (iron transport regulator)
MDFQHYTVKDFVMNDSFQQWVLKGNDYFWENWVKDHPEKSVEVEEAKRMLLSLHFHNEELSQEQYNRISNRIEQRVMAYEKSQRKLPLWGTLIKHYRVAASILVILAATTLFFWLLQTRSVVYATKYGETRTIILPDHSKVILNANSSLRFSNNWRGKLNREVWLEGEAFFDVEKKQLAASSVKFTVHTDDVQIEVIGTEFTVSKRQTNTWVVLNEGKIKLDVLNEPAKQNIVMRPGDWIEYQAEHRKLVHKTVNAEVYSSWISKKWILENTSLKQVAKRFEETFGINVIIADKRLATESMTGVIPVETLDDALEVLSATYDVRIKQKGNQVFITK